jgi:DNA-binding MarR family transcriptional regulator
MWSTRLTNDVAAGMIRHMTRKRDTTGTTPRPGPGRPAGRTLEAEQQASFGHVLLAAARLYDGLGQARLNEALGEDVARPSVMRLIPYVTRAGIRPTELARLADVTKQAVGQTLARLEEQGLVEFAPDPSDGRAVLVRMTRAGEDAALAGLRALADVQRQLERRVGGDVVTAAFVALRGILAELEAMTPAGRQ